MKATIGLELFGEVQGKLMEIIEQGPSQ